MAKIEMTWKGDNLFESENPGGNVFIDNPYEGEDSRGLRPKALMLTSLAGCGALDIVSLLKKMRAEVDDFKIDVSAELTEEHPKIYKNVVVTYRFFGSDFKKDKIEKAVNLSVEKYCGVMEMFRKFTDVAVEIEYIEQ
ncbi:OsmC family protein [Urechidicola croceus]|uniref:Osmotically inducible protein OsmC n=1 Tax=Urechidicola croceus TaxID=1850246 RepID=A0A1D8P8W4_9FLAO|nr:OsmC family protein [Urechidicola croceus]AOW20992.1 osmotically inducible protein OsmC [Urechidicola croceus]